MIFFFLLLPSHPFENPLKLCGNAECLYIHSDIMHWTHGRLFLAGEIPSFTGRQDPHTFLIKRPRLEHVALSRQHRALTCPSHPVVIRSNAKQMNLPFTALLFDVSFMLFQCIFPERRHSWQMLCGKMLEHDSLDGCGFWSFCD